MRATALLARHAIRRFLQTSEPGHSLARGALSKSVEHDGHACLRAPRMHGRCAVGNSMEAAGDGAAWLGAHRAATIGHVAAR